MQPKPASSFPAHVLAGLGLLIVCACSVGPDLPRRGTTDATEPPRLLPLSRLPAPGAGRTQAELGAGPEQRAAALRARAAGLRAPVIGAEQRAWLLASENRIR